VRRSPREQPELDLDWWLLQYLSTDRKPKVEAVWREVRDELLAAWIREHPVRRPWAWWQFDAPEPRGKFVDGRLVAEPHDECGPPGHRSTNDFGFPETWLEEETGRHVFESEPAFLDRHGLLSAAERRRLGPEAFEHEVVVVGLDGTGEVTSLGAVPAGA